MILYIFLQFERKSVEYSINKVVALIVSSIFFHGNFLMVAFKSPRSLSTLMKFGGGFQLRHGNHSLVVEAQVETK